MQVPAELSEAVLTLATTAIVGLIGILTRKVGKYIDRLKNKQLQEGFKIAHEHVSVIAENAVLAVKQTLTDELRIDGKLNKDDASRALASAKQYFYDNVSDAMLDVVEEELGIADTWLGDMLESKLGKTKK